MKTTLLLILTVLFFTTTNAQDVENSKIVIPTKYEIVVSFGSICCGPPSDIFLKSFINTFNDKNKITINCWQLTGCGREGESKVLFSLQNLNTSKRTKFLKAIKKIVPQQNQQNKTANASTGNINLDYEVLLSNINNCRNKIVMYNLSTK